MMIFWSQFVSTHCTGSWYSWAAWYTTTHQVVIADFDFTQKPLSVVRIIVSHLESVQFVLRCSAADPSEREETIKGRQKAVVWVH